MKNCKNTEKKNNKTLEKIKIHFHWLYIKLNRIYDKIIPNLYNINIKTFQQQQQQQKLHMLLCIHSLCSLTTKKCTKYVLNCEENVCSIADCNQINPFPIKYIRDLNTQPNKHTTNTCIKNHTRNRKHTIYTKVHLYLEHSTENRIGGKKSRKIKGRLVQSYVGFFFITNHTCHTWIKSLSSFNFHYIIILKFFRRTKPSSSSSLGDFSLLHIVYEKNVCFVVVTIIQSTIYRMVYRNCVSVEIHLFLPFNSSMIVCCVVYVYVYLHTVHKKTKKNHKLPQLIMFFFTYISTKILYTYDEDFDVLFNIFHRKKKTNLVEMDERRSLLLFQ